MQWRNGSADYLTHSGATILPIPSSNPCACWAKTRINEILASVIHPMLVSSDQADWESYKKDPGGTKQSATGNRMPASVRRDRSCQEHVRFPYQQQGLLQIFEDFCLADTTNCAGCQFPKMDCQIGVTTRPFFFFSYLTCPSSPSSQNRQPCTNFAANRLRSHSWI